MEFKGDGWESRARVRPWCSRALGEEASPAERGRAGPRPWIGAGRRLQQPWGGERAAAPGLVLAWG
jgi:hypothetical protein